MFIVAMILFRFNHSLMEISCHFSPFSSSRSLNQWERERRKRILFFNHSEDEEKHLNDQSIWCLPLLHHLDAEEYYPRSPNLTIPSLNETWYSRLPYRYSHWKSSSTLPRRLTKCEHMLVMHLLLIIDRICRIYRIPYMMSDGTLLGSWRHHDIIPWDDDIDLMIPFEEKKRFVHALNEMNETLIEYHILKSSRSKREYYKIYFSHTPSAGGYSWNFPFVDVFLYEKNETHLWQVEDFDTIVPIENIFPLVLRPLGELWLPSPSFPSKIFSFDPFDRCIGHFWDHRNETPIEQIDLQCQDLFDVYPFVHRTNSSPTIEILQLNHSILHRIIPQ